MAAYDSPAEITRRSQIRYLRVVKIIPGCCVVSYNAANILMAFFSFAMLCCSVAVLTGSYGRGWGFWVKFGDFPLYAGATGLPLYAPVSFAIWFGYAWYSDSYLEDHSYIDHVRLSVAISSAAQAWGIIVAITMCITTGVSFCYGMSSLSFLRGWYEIGAASGGNKAAIPSLILGLWTISVAAIFYGVSLRGVNRYWVTPPPLLKMTNVVKDGVKITPDWAFYLCVIISILFFLMAYLAFVLPTQDDLMEWLQKVDNPNPPKLATPLGQLPEAITKSIKIPAVLKSSSAKGDLPPDMLVDVEQSGITATTAAGRDVAASSAV